MVWLDKGALETTSERSIGEDCRTSVELDLESTLFGCGCGALYFMHEALIEIFKRSPIQARWLQYFKVGTKFSKQWAVCHTSLGYSTVFGTLVAVF
jgi:hypothetical protein